MTVGKIENGLEHGFVKHRLNCLLITDPVFRKFNNGADCSVPNSISEAALKQQFPSPKVFERNKFCIISIGIRSQELKLIASGSCITFSEVYEDGNSRSTI